LQIESLTRKLEEAVSEVQKYSASQVKSIYIYVFHG
jgi:hypothetical protein